MIVNNMKRGLILLGVVLVSFLTISSVTAHPYTQSRPVMDVVSELEALEAKTENTIELTDIATNTLGIIDLIKQILTMILNLIISLIQFVLGLMDIVELIEAIINAIYTLIDIITEFINMIIDLFTPGLQAAI